MPKPKSDSSARLFITSSTRPDLNFPLQPPILIHSRIKLVRLDHKTSNKANDNNRRHTDPDRLDRQRECFADLAAEWFVEGGDEGNGCVGEFSGWNAP